VGLVYRIYGVKLLESKVNDMWIYVVGFVYRVSGMKLLESNAK
jgi:hypothetical protein